MRHKYNILAVAAFALCIIISAKPYPGTEPTRWVVTENSSLRVTGTTNVSKFICEINGYNNPDTINIKNINQFTRLTGNVNLDINNFNCHNAMMTKELRKTLKAEQYPTLCIEFISLSGMPQLNLRPACMTGVVEIHLAGKSKRYLINYEVSADANKIIHLNGDKEINFSDFDLKAPKKIGGIITAKDKLLVQFNLNLKNI